MVTHIGRFGLVAILFTIGACGRTDGSNDQPADTSRAATPSVGLDGAWRLAEFRPQGGAPITNPASVFLFSNGHYSFMYVNTANARKAFAKADSATNAEKVGAYDTFIANAGTYVLTGDTLTIRPQIARNPNYMGGGEDKFVTRQSGDTLLLTNVPGAFRWANGQAATAGAGSDSFILLRAR